MRIRARMLWLTASVVVMMVPGLAAPAAPLPLGKLLQMADAVVVATVQNQVVSGPDVSLSLTAVRVLKGSVMPGSNLYVTWSPPVPPDSTLLGRSTAGSGVWFLKQGAAGWTALPISAGAISFEGVYFTVPSRSLQAGNAYDPQASLQERFASELAAAARDPESAPAVAHVIAGGAIDDFDPVVLSPIWSQLASDPSASTRAIGLAGQIRLGASSALVAVANTDAAAFPADAQDHLSIAICQYHNPDSAGINALGALVKSSYADTVRFCAMHALRAIHNKDTLVYLSALLDAGSVRAQYEAIAGIASFANGFPIQAAENAANMGFLTASGNAPLATSDTQKYFPTRSAFAKQPEMYVSFWKNWLVANQLK